MSTLKRIACTGSRTWRDAALLEAVLDAHQARYPRRVVVGDARGADACVRSWGNRAGCHVEVFYADWETHGKAAGPIRNQTMLLSDGVEHLYAFRVGPESKGTDHAISVARKYGITVTIVEVSA